VLSDVFKDATKPVKNWVRREFNRRGYEILAEPFDHRLVQMIKHFGIDTVIDGGANVGQYGQTLRRAGFTGRIFSAEPLSSAFAELSVAAGQDPLWTAERLAFSDTEGSIDMNIAANSVSSSALPMLRAHSDAAPDSVFIGKESAPSSSLDAFVERHGIDPATTMLKLDVQGYEGTALAGATESIGRFAAAQMELSYVPLYDGQWLADDVIEFLRKQGYELWMFDPAAMYEPESKRMLQCDGIFVRE
jgi:FkbM family methyltransferase